MKIFLRAIFLVSLALPLSGQAATIHVRTFVNGVQTPVPVNYTIYGDDGPFSGTGPATFTAQLDSSDLYIIFPSISNYPNHFNMLLDMGVSNRAFDLYYGTVPVSSMPPSCPLGSGPPGRIIVPFTPYEGIASPWYTDPSGGPFSTNIPSGNYSVTAVGFDTHVGIGGSGWQMQPNEQFYLILRNSSGSVVAQTNSTSDIPDFQNYNGSSNSGEVVNPSLTIPQNIASIEPYHSTYPDGTNYGSLYPVCAAFDPLSSPLPNLRITDFDVNNGTAGATGYANVTIENIGNSATGNFEIGFRDGLPSAGISCTNEEIGTGTTSLAPGQVRSVSIPFTYPAVGNYTARILADSDCQILESDEGDNDDSDSYSTFAPPPPDYGLVATPATIFANIVNTQDVTSNTAVITATSFNGFSGNVDLSVTSISPSIPGAVTHFFNDPPPPNARINIPANGSASSQYSIRIPSDTPKGTYTITVRASGSINCR
jgi:hypothetical protein